MWSRIVRRSTFVAVLLGAVAPVAASAQESTPESQLERDARLARRGAGLRGGAWEVRGLTETGGVEYATTPAFEGFFQKGLDKHLAWENSIGFWRRSQTVPGTSGLGGRSEERINVYVVPTFTALKLFPFTTPAHRLEPYFEGGAGFGLGIEDRETSGAGGLLGGGGSNGTQIVPGFGFKGGAGVDLRFSRAFGVTLGARYQWMKFFQDLGGERTYGGLGYDAGLIYRFQY